MPGDDAIELGQRLDLIDNDTPHLRRAVRGLLRQLEHPAPQFGTCSFELTLHFRRHLLHALHDVGEAFGGLREYGLSSPAFSS